MTKYYLVQCTECYNKCLVTFSEDDDWDAVIPLESCWMNGDPVTWKLIKGVK